MCYLSCQNNHFYSLSVPGGSFFFYYSCHSSIFFVVIFTSPKMWMEAIQPKTFDGLLTACTHRDQPSIFSHLAGGSGKIWRFVRWWGKRFVGKRNGTIPAADSLFYQVDRKVIATQRSTAKHNEENRTKFVTTETRTFRAAQQVIGEICFRYSRPGLETKGASVIYGALIMAESIEIRYFIDTLSLAK